MVIPIFIHKHDQQIPRSREWRGSSLTTDCAQFVCGCGQSVCCGSQQLRSSICSFCSSYWGSCIALFLFLFQVRCVQLFRIVRLFRIHSSSIQFKSIHGVWMRTLWASSCAPLHRTLTLPTYVCHSLRKALVALHSTIQKIPKWVCFAVEWVLDYER